MTADAIATVIGSAAITVSFILVGFRLLFYTQTFDQEYSDKARSIRDHKNSKLVNSIDDLSKIRRGLRAKREIVEAGDPLRQWDQLAEVRRQAKEVEYWAEIIEVGKAIIRWWSLSIIVLGMVFTAVFLVLVTLQDYFIVGLILWYGVGIVLVACYYFGARYWKLASEIDSEYIAVRQRATGKEGGLTVGEIFPAH